MTDGNIQAARVKLARAVQKLCSPKPFSGRGIRVGVEPIVRGCFSGEGGRQ